MPHTFYKYQGTGNDFIMIDNRQQLFDKNDTKLISFLCDRRFGIGADGLILLENHDEYDFKMVYFNSDGNESSMCGNGGRCIASFARYMGIADKETTFEAIDGIHKARLNGDKVSLLMQDVAKIEKHENHVFLDTGSPHHVEITSMLPQMDVKEKGAEIRYGKPYSDSGTNVNFVEKVSDDKFAIRTYERGVEDETLSCGTGVTAVALAMNYIGETEKNIIHLETRGGQLEVSFSGNDEGYTDIWLKGPAKQVFKGEMEW
jgi:diaminopimelate epimerase